MMSKLLSLKVAKHPPPIPPRQEEEWAQAISWHCADETIPLRSRPSFSAVDFTFYYAELLLPDSLYFFFLLLLFLFLRSRQRQDVTRDRMAALSVHR